MSNPNDMDLARCHDAGLISAVELVELIIDDEQDKQCPVDPLMLARRIVSTLQY